MRSVVAIRHVPFEDLGSFGAELNQRGYDVRYVEAGLHDIGAIDPLGPDLLVVLGAPIGANDEADYPFLRDEFALLERRLAADRPTLGICLGSQLMARVLGGRVYPGGRKEIGWSPLTLSAAGAAGPLAALGPEQTQVLHWHGDTFDLPPGAVHLAASEAYQNQAFAFGERALALQFHPEVTVAGMERWFIGHAGEIGATPGIDVPGLRAATAELGPALEVQGRRFFADWLGRVEA